MKLPFGRREAAAPETLPPIPDHVDETWRASTNEVVLRSAVDVAPEADHEAADRLSDVVLGMVRGVREGAFGHCMPADATGAGVRLEASVPEDAYGVYARREAEDLVGRLAGVAPFAVVAYPRGGAAPVWDDAAQTLRVDLDGSLGPDDASSAAAVRSLLQATLTAVTSDRLLGVVPEAAGDSYPVAITLAVRDHHGTGRGERTTAVLEQMQRQLAPTRVSLTVTGP